MEDFSSSEVNEFLHSSEQKQSYKMKGHSFVALKGVGKQYCSCCGLVALNNPATGWCIEKGCNHSDHSSYKSAMKRLTKQKRGY